MTLKALMVDVDGVVVRHPRHGRRWDETMEVDLGLKSDDLQSRFFRPYFRDIVLGREALEDRLALVLPAIAPHLTPRQLMTYWFEQDAHLDHTLLEDLKAIRATGVQLHLATVQEHQRAAYLWNELGLKDHFDGLHHSAAIGFKKPDAAYFSAVEARTGFAARDLLLIDDSAVNVEAAKAAGWGGVLWTGEARLSQVLP